MDFLRRFQRGLVVSRTVVGLVPEAGIPDPDVAAPAASHPDGAEQMVSDPVAPDPDEH